MATLLIAHAIAHLVGFAWPRWVLEPLPFSSEFPVMGDAEVQTLSILWLVAAVAFLVAALTLLRAGNLWRRVTAWAAVASLALSVLCWPGSLLGVPINVGILAGLHATRRPSWCHHRR